MKEKNVSLEELRGNRLQAEVANKLSISKSYLSLLENGKRRMSLDLAEKLAKLYGVNVEVIFHAYKVCGMSTDKPQAS